MALLLLMQEYGVASSVQKGLI